MNILYTTNCPRCKLLKTRLDILGIEYEICNDKDKMLAMGMTSVPMLQVGEVIMTFKEALEWISSEEKYV